MNPSLEIVEKAVKAAVPEIMELKFGCEVKVFGSHKAMVVGVYESEGREKISINDGGAQWSQDTYSGSLVTRFNYEILGRPIQLPDVLLAIEKHVREKFESQPNADLLSNFQEGLWGITKDLLEKWNLHKPLHDQDPFVWEFLAGILAS